MRLYNECWQELCSIIFQNHQLWTSLLKISMRLSSENWLASRGNLVTRKVDEKMLMVHQDVSNGTKMRFWALESKKISLGDLWNNSNSRRQNFYPNVLLPDWRKNHFIFWMSVSKDLQGQCILEQAVLFFTTGMDISELMNVTMYKTKPRSQRKPEW